MGGGLMNLVSQASGNNFLTGDASKTYFKSLYAKHTNFGLQKFRIDYEGSRDLRLTEPSTFSFKIPRHADLLLDTYIVITLPDIFSPIYHPCESTNQKWSPYNFKWVKDLGTTIVQSVEITAGSSLLAKFTGDYINLVNSRDLTTSKKTTFDKMTGNVPELNDPANFGARKNTYPSTYFTGESGDQEPSIRGRNLYVPISTWFCINSKSALPLVAMQYSEVTITVTLRPIQQLFQVRDVFDWEYNFPYVAPDFTKQEFQMYRFLQSPPFERIDLEYYNSINVNDWNADIHLISTYAFLSPEETRVMVSEQQSYLVRDVMQYEFQNVTGSKRVELKSQGMVSTWMFYLRRNDVNLRNEWSNFTNWPYDFLPQDISLPPAGSDTIFSTVLLESNGGYASTGPGTNPEGTGTDIYITGSRKESNRKDILMSVAILLDGTYRENTMSEGIVNYVEQFGRCENNLPPGVYTYNFGLNPSIQCLQPSGAINMNSFGTIELEISTYLPTVDVNASNFQFICSEGTVIGVRKENWRLFEYTYDLVVMEERFNVVMVKNGECKMMLAR